MSEKQSRVQTVEKLFLYFLMAAVIGWCYEVFLEVVVYRWGFDNRGVLFGPYCPVYGVGMLAFLLCFGKFAQMPMKWSIRWARPILIFLGCGAVATVIAPATCWNGLPAAGRGRHMQTMTLTSRQELRFRRPSVLASAACCFCICSVRCSQK